MAKEKKYTEQMPFVGTMVQKILIENQAIEERCSRADVVRRALDEYFGLDDGLMPPGEPDPIALPDPREPLPGTPLAFQTAIEGL